MGQRFRVGGTEIYRYLQQIEAPGPTNVQRIQPGEIMRLDNIDIGKKCFWKP